MLRGDWAGLRAFAIPMPVKFRGVTVREGALIEGPA
ncbi:MAG TPA: O-succinylbenzoate synthase, partial [Streptosporangiaceae bacterium]|nr:O-succinylbenzoate synthase [Streptosporangiaceae bacterium]